MEGWSNGSDGFHYSTIPIPRRRGSFRIEPLEPGTQSGRRHDRRKAFC